MVDHYTYRVFWSEEDQGFVAACAEFPSMSHVAESRAAALAGIEKLVADVAAGMRADDEQLPSALADQKFSGKFQARVPGHLHRQLAIEAAEQGVSLNRLVSHKLAAPLPARQPRRGRETR